MPASDVAVSDGHPDDSHPLPRPVVDSPAWRDMGAAWLAHLGRLIGRHRRAAVLAGALVLVLGAGIGGLVLGRRAAAPRVVPVEEVYPRLDAAMVAAEVEAVADPRGEVVVHVAGAVHAPGVYVLASVSRVDDAIAAAGGALPDGDLDRLNLAAPLVDGSRVFVPVVGEAVPVPVEPISGDSSSGAAVIVDLNVADVSALERLPGVGPATAAAIVAHRDEHGPFASVDELLDVPGIGPAKLSTLEPLVRTS